MGVAGEIHGPVCLRRGGLAAICVALAFRAQRVIGILAVRNVVFDFGGVLVRWRPLELIESFYPDGPLRARVREMVFEHPDWVEMDRGTLSDAAAAERFAARLGRPQAEMHSLLQHVKDSLTPLPDTVAIVRALKNRGVPIYGLSNMSAATFAHLRD